jgi:hypothetical protein
MKKNLLCFLALLIATITSAQLKVASYAIGKFGTDKFEEFAFWIKDGKKTEISYAYGKNEKEIKLKYAGVTILNNDSCFRVQFSHNYILYIIPKGVKLKVIDSSGKYHKNFSWLYEGPVNGIGTYCDVCAAGPDEAMEIIRSYYMK